MADKTLNTKSLKVQFRAGDFSPHITIRTPEDSGTSQTGRRHLGNYYELMELGRRDLDFSTEQMLFLLDSFRGLINSMPRGALVEHFHHLAQGMIYEMSEAAFPNLDRSALGAKLRVMSQLQVAALMDLIECYWCQARQPRAAPSMIKQVMEDMSAAARGVSL